MSEEEKEAIRELESEYSSCNYNDSDLIVELETARIVLNLIEKQQKEIEELKAGIYETSESYKLKKRELELYLQQFNNNYISKYKIKDKMNEIMSYTISSSGERHCQNYAYDRLKELLGEENE